MAWTYFSFDHLQLFIRILRLLMILIATSNIFTVSGDFWITPPSVYQMVFCLVSIRSFFFSSFKFRPITELIKENVAIAAIEIALVKQSFECIFSLRYVLENSPMKRLDNVELFSPYFQIIDARIVLFFWF